MHQALLGYDASAGVDTPSEPPGGGEGGQKEGHHTQVPLMLAAEQGRREIAEALMQAGANPRALDSQGRTASQVCLRKRCHGCASVLSRPVHLQADLNPPTRPPDYSSTTCSVYTDNWKRWYGVPPGRRGFRAPRAREDPHHVGCSGTVGWPFEDLRTFELCSRSKICSKICRPGACCYCLLCVKEYTSLRADWPSAGRL